MGQKWRKRSASAPVGVDATHSRSSRLREVDKRERRARTEVEEADLAVRVEWSEWAVEEGEKSVGVDVASSGWIVRGLLGF